MDHYEVLGAPPTASHEELRRAYLRQARRHHPDRASTADTTARAAAERRMRDVNEAWRVLSDPVSRAAYDRGRGRSAAGSSGSSTTPGNDTGPVINRPSSRFVPVDDGDDSPGDGSLRDVPDAFDPNTAIGRFLGVAPAGFVAVGLAVAALGLVMAARPLIAVALICLLLGGLLFVAAPLVALARSAAADPDGRRGSGSAPGRGR